EALEVTGSLRFEDHRGRVSVLQEHEVEDESTYAAVTVDEGMNALEPGVVDRGVDDRVRTFEITCRVAPAREISRYGRRNRNHHAGNPNGTLPPRARLIPGSG